VSSRVRLTKTPDEYAAARGSRRELSYEALLAAGQESWRTGDRIRVYRNQRGEGRLVPGEDDEDRRDYDVDHYLRILRDLYAARLERAFLPEDYATVFADADQLSLFVRDLAGIRPVLQHVPATAAAQAPGAGSR
jgi:hypothetical protein